MSASPLERQIYVRTPLIESIPLRAYTGDRPVYLKLENTQPSGSFKLRGISALCKYAQASGFTKMVCSSSGNAGLATAYCARKLGLDCHIVVFRLTPEDVRSRIRAYGATVEMYGEVWDEAYEHAVRLTQGSTAAFLVHPFNHPRLWEGHSTMIGEIAEDLGPEEVPSLIVTCCGGGGLTSGIVAGVRAQGWQAKTAILVMETIGAESFNVCVQAGGQKVTLEAISSIAGPLITRQVCDQILVDLKINSPPLLSRLVSDKEVIQACLAFANDHRLIVGTACGAALAAVYTSIVKHLMENETEEGVRMRQDGPIVVIVCGGAEMTVDSLNQLKEEFNC